MLTDKFEELSKEVKANFLEYKEEAKLQQKHREESIKFHADLLEKLDNRFAGKWTEQVRIQEEAIRESVQSSITSTIG